MSNRCISPKIKESRGSHVRLDFPQRDDINFLKHTLAYKTLEGPELIQFSTCVDNSIHTEVEKSIEASG